MLFLSTKPPLLLRRNVRHIITMSSPEQQAQLLGWLQSKRTEIENLAKRRFFYRQSFDIYGGVSGFYDYGPPGCALKRQLEDTWRNHFVLEEDMLEVNCPNMTPEIVLQASGHVEKFTDYMVKDEVQGTCFRADKYLEDKMEEFMKKPETTEAQREEYMLIQAQADSYTDSQLHEIFQRFNILSPNNNPLSFPEAFNLMFGSMIGPSGKLRGFLRPETAQGIFVNFKQLLEFNRGKMPFAAAQIGIGFRNEISPREGLLRVREFTMAEIEHFVHPEKKSHPKFETVFDLVLPLFTQNLQLTNQQPTYLSLGEAVAQGVINNQTLGYFIGRTYLFLTQQGIHTNGIRFRQHLPNEMAHYAADCWDAEILTSYGWKECVGIADRSCYDLSRHSQVSKKNMQAAEQFAEPKEIEFIDMKPNKGLIGKEFKQKAQLVFQGLEGLSEGQKEEILQKLADGSPAELNIGEETIVLNANMIAPQRTVKRVSQETYYPSVIEPSFGIGRIFYAILEHSYKERTDLTEVRSYLGLPIHLAPIKCSILPLSNNAQFTPFVKQIRQLVTRQGLSSEVDESSSTIGKKYARTDEIGIPFAVTVDFQTIEDETVTLREIHSMGQIRIPIADLAERLRQLANRQVTWEEVSEVYPKFTAQASQVFNEFE